MFGGRKHDESAVAAGGHGGGFKLNAGAKTGLLIAELLTLLVSVPCLQHTAFPPLASSTQRCLLCPPFMVWPIGLLGNPHIQQCKSKRMMECAWMLKVCHQLSDQLMSLR